MRRLRLVPAGSIDLEPLGVLFTRPRLRPLAAPFLTLANIGQAIPSIGILVLRDDRRARHGR